MPFSFVRIIREHLSDEWEMFNGLQLSTFISPTLSDGELRISCVLAISWLESGLSKRCIVDWPLRLGESLAGTRINENTLRGDRYKVAAAMIRRTEEPSSDDVWKPIRGN